MTRFERGAGFRRRRSALAITAAVAALGGGLLIAPTSASAAAGCRAVYSVNSWNVGFSGGVTITNLGDPLTSWKLEFDFAGNQQLTQAWGGKYTQSGKHVTITNETWNGSVGTNGTANPG